MSTNYGNPLDPDPAMLADLMRQANTTPNMNQTYYYDGSGSYNTAPPVNPFLNNNGQNTQVETRRNMIGNPPPTPYPQNSVYPQQPPMNGGLNSMIETRRNNMAPVQQTNPWGAATSNPVMLSQQLDSYYGYPNQQIDYFAPPQQNQNYGMPLPGQTQGQQQFMYEKISAKPETYYDINQQQKTIPAPVINWEHVQQQHQFQNNQYGYGYNTYGQPQYPIQQPSQYGYNISVPTDANWKEIVEKNFVNI